MSYFKGEAMLDAAELAKRLRSAMDLHEPKITLTELAQACEVTPQAVYSWRTTGRIAKKHLSTISKLTGKPLAFYLEVERGETKETREAWHQIAAVFARVGMSAAIAAIPFFSNDSSASTKPSSSGGAVYYGKSLIRRIREFFHGLRRFRTYG